MSDEKKKQWVVVWETGDGPEVSGPYGSEREATLGAYAEWVSWSGGIVGGFNEGDLVEFEAVYAESDKVWIVPLGPGAAAWE